MRVLKYLIRIKILAYSSLDRPVLECVSAYRDPCTEEQINVLDRVQKKAAQCINHTKNSDCETMAKRRKIASLCVLLKRSVGNGL